MSIAAFSPFLLNVAGGRRLTDKVAAVFYLSVVAFLPILTSPIIQDQYTAIKWQLIYGAAIFSIGYFIVSQVLQVPRFSRVTQIALIMFVSAVAISMLYHDVPIVSKPVIDRVSFVILALAFCHIFSSGILSLSSFILPAAISLAIFLSIMIYEFFLTNQYAGVVTIFTAYGLYNFWSKLPARVVFLALLSCGLFYISLTGCRSVYLGLLLGAIYLFSTFKAKWFNKTSIAIVCFAVGVGALLKVYLPAESGGSAPVSAFSETKHESANHRIHIWSRTINMINDNPLGVGQGQFEFSFIPYKKGDKDYPPNEQLLERTPHSEVLRYMVEDGLIVFILGFCFIALMVTQNQNSLVAYLLNKENAFIVMLLIMLGVQFLIQFPLFTPYTFFIIAILAGYLLSLVKEDIIVKPHRAFLAIGLCGYLAIFSSLLYAEYVDANHPFDLSKTSLSCNISPGNWRVCFQKVAQELDEGNLEMALASTEKELKKNPDNFLAKMYRGYALMDMNRQVEACRVFREYNELFGSKSSLKYMERVCKAYQAS
ncbi:MAG: O-antigen ligase family protein [Alphaproteobacteria bacterium]